MNLHNAVALVRNDITTVSGRFLYQNRNNDTEYTFKVKRSLASQLSEGDLAICHSQRGYSLFVVHEVHSEPQIDPDTSFTYQWAFQKVATHLYQRLLEQDDALHEQLQAKQRAHTRQRTLDALGMTETEVQQTLQLGYNPT